MFILHKATGVGIVLALLSCAAMAAGSQDARIRFTVEAKPLRVALNKWAEQAGLSVVFPAGQPAADRVATRVDGEYSASEALDLLLKGSGLTWAYVDRQTVAIRVRGEGASSVPGPADQMRVAAQGDASGVQGREARIASPEKADVVVEGERDRPAPFSTANLDLTRTEDDALPFMVFDAREIQLSGAADLQEFLRNRLPQNFSPDVMDEIDTVTSNQYGGTGLVDLRGWGITDVVFLLNGRRMPAHYQMNYADTVASVPSLRGIPLASIERIEVLASAGSAIYGVSATGGVINIITRQDFTGGQIAVNYESPADTHAPRRGMDATYGLPLKWGLGLRLGASYSDSEPVQVGHRAAVSIERWRRLAMERDPARLINQLSGNPLRTTSAVFGATPNIRAHAFAGNLFADLPGAPDSNFTTVPAGSTGTAPLSAYQPGVWDTGLAEGSAGSGLYARASTLGNSQVNTVFSIGLDRNFGERWRWSFDAQHTDGRSENTPAGAMAFSSSALSVSPFVPAEAPTNPFDQSVQVRLVDPLLARGELTDHARNTSWNLSSTLRGAIGEWHGYIDVSSSHHRYRNVQNVFAEPIGGWTAAFLSGAYNPFVDTRVVAPAAPEFYEHYIARRDFRDSGTRNYGSSIKMSGPLPGLPTGRPQLTAGVDWSRADRYRSEWFGQYQDSQTGEPRAVVGGPANIVYVAPNNQRFMFDSLGGYAEITLPLLSSMQGVPLVERLELFASGRVNRLVRHGLRGTQTGGSLDPVKYTTTSRLHVIGLSYEVVEGVALRATESTGFKPPSLLQITPLAGAPTSPVTGLRDPLRDEPLTLAQGMYIYGGNPDVLPETTDSRNFGLIFTPRWIPGLRVSLDYLESVRSDAIFSLTAQEAINLEQELAGVVRRAAPDGHASGVGPIEFVDYRQTNLREIASRSLDISVEQQLREMFGGRVVLSATATRNISFKVQTTNTGSSVEQVRNPTGAFARQIEWNGGAQLRWEGPQWSVGWSVRYLDYILADPAFYVLQGSDRAPRAFNHDLNLSYRAPVLEGSGGVRSLFAGTALSFGVKNVFDRTPRFWAASTDRGIAPYDSIMGRSVWMNLRKDY